jgi:hypothetical protein
MLLSSGLPSSLLLLVGCCAVAACAEAARAGALVAVARGRCGAVCKGRGGQVGGWVAALQHVGMFANMPATLAALLSNPRCAVCVHRTGGGRSVLLVVCAARCFTAFERKLQTISSAYCNVCAYCCYGAPGALQQCWRGTIKAVRSQCRRMWFFERSECRHNNACQFVATWTLSKSKRRHQSG